MAIGDIYQVTVKALLHGQTILNVLHYLREDAGAGNGSEDLVTQFRANVEASWRDCCSNELVITGYLGQRIRPVPITSAYEVSGLALAGTVVQNSLPTSVAAVITKRTANAGRSYRGRMFMAGVPVTFEIDSQITGAAENLYNALAGDIMSGISHPSGAEFGPVLWRRSANLAQDLTQMIARVPLRNQRRRQVGRGI